MEEAAQTLLVISKMPTPQCGPETDVIPSPQVNQFAAAAKLSDNSSAVTSARKVAGMRKRSSFPPEDDEGYETARGVCSNEGCTNKAYQRGMCIKHGSKNKHKLCSSTGCTNIAVKGGVCLLHVKQCSIDGCTNNAMTGGVCMKHGAKVKICSNHGCTNVVVSGGVCYTWRKGQTMQP